MDRAVLPVLLALTACAGPPEKDSALDDATRNLVREEVGDFLEAVSEDLEARGPLAWFSHYALEDPAFSLAPNGALIAGRPALIRSLAELSATDIESCSFELHDPQILPLDRNRAFLDGEASSHWTTTAGQRRSSGGYLSALVVRGPQGWRFLKIHGSPPRNTGVASEVDSADIEAELLRTLDQLCADLAERGPRAWIDHFSQSPEFRMASDGEVLFRTSLDLESAMNGFAAQVERLELNFSDVRTVVLGTDSAHVSAAFDEILTYTSGEREEMRGHFTALAVREGEEWRLLNAHWSQAN